MGLASVTYKLPALSTAMAFGQTNCADVPTPSKEPASALPASVVTLRLPMEIIRMRWLLQSATYTLPKLSTATP